MHMRLTERAVYAYFYYYGTLCFNFFSVWERIIIDGFEKPVYDYFCLLQIKGRSLHVIIHPTKAPELLTGKRAVDEEEVHRYFGGCLSEHHFRKLLFKPGKVTSCTKTKASEKNKNREHRWGCEPRSRPPL